MLELGKTGTAGRGRGDTPVRADGRVAAVLRVATSRQAAAAAVDDGSWAASVAAT